MIQGYNSLSVYIHKLSIKVFFKLENNNNNKKPHTHSLTQWQVNYLPHVSFNIRGLIFSLYNKCELLENTLLWHSLKNKGGLR